jgi:hypothetical protein
MQRVRTTPENFWPRFKPAPAPEKYKHLGDCWLWTGYTKDNGSGVIYGKTTVNFKQWYTHRLAWFWTHGDIPKGLQVAHTCHVSTCGNPAHLHLATSKQNIHESIAADRNSKGAKHSAAQAGKMRKGEECSWATFTTEQIIEIRRLHDVEGMTPKQIGERFGRRRETIGKITRREKWKHVI